MIIAIIALLCSQTIKVIIYTIVNHRFDTSRLNGDGGMPSSHSSIVSAVATMSALVYGISSEIFGISFVFAIIVCHDAMHSRQEIGKQAVVINKMLQDLMEGEHTDKFLEEFVGHTPFQVLAGIILGIGISILFYFIFIV